jgi:hypothetical protein
LYGFLIILVAVSPLSPARFYIDGVLVQTIPYVTDPFRGGTNYELGYRDHLQNPAIQARFKGLMDDVRLYGTVLSASEIAANMGPRPLCDQSQSVPQCPLQTPVNMDFITSCPGGPTQWPNIRTSFKTELTKHSLSSGTARSHE